MGDNTIQAEPLNAQEDQQKIDEKSIRIKISVKTTIIIAVIIAVGALAYFYKGLFVAATVDGSYISRLTIIQELEKASGEDLLDSLIVKKLIQNEVNAKKIVVSDDEINGEIKRIEYQIMAQGSAIDAALAAQGMSMEDLEKQIVLQKQVEKLVADKINVTDEEVSQYIKDNTISIPEGQEAMIIIQIKDELRNQKINAEADVLITALKSQANIRYFVNY